MNPPFFVFSANSPSKYELSAVCLGKVRLDVIADVEPVVGKRKTVAYAYGLIVWLFIDIGSIAHLAVQIPSYSYLQGEMSEIDFMAQRKSHYVPAYACIASSRGKGRAGVWQKHTGHRCSLFLCPRRSVGNSGT